MTEERYPRLSLALKALSPFVTVGGLLIGVWKFEAGDANSRARETQAETEGRDRLLLQNRAIDEMNYRRALWEKRRDTYVTIGDAVGQVASSVDDRKAFDSAVKRFDALYWGGMVLVEDASVEEAMKQMHDEIVDFRSDRSNPDRIKQRAYAVGQACRASLEQYKPTMDAGAP